MYSKHNGPKVEATQVSTDRWIDTQNVINTYKMNYSAFKKEGTSDTHNMNRKDITLSGVSTSQRINIVWFLFHKEQSQS